MDLIRTVGHGTLSSEEMIHLLQGAGIELLADVRRYPGSRRQPHLAREQMERWIPEGGIAYEWIVELGGRRRPDRASPNIGLRNEQFRAYADHMTTDEFAVGLERLADAAERGAVAVMCSETVWWRCHRRLLADHLVLLEGAKVEHLFHDGRLSTHPLTPGVHVEGNDHLLYEPVEEEPLLAKRS
jgi:uncharacterized protein (DUF488 family)